MNGKLVINNRQRLDLEMLLNGAFNPLDGFMGRDTYENVLDNMRLECNSPWPIPITLDVTEEFAKNHSLGDTITLHDADNTPLAKLTIKDKWQIDKDAESKKVFGTVDQKHPAVNYLHNQTKDWYLGGKLEQLKEPKHYDFLELRHTPNSLKQLFVSLGWEKIVAFQTRNPLHRAHMELTLRAAKQIDGNILIQPVVGMTKPGDIDYITRVHCYQKIMSYYPQNKALLSLLPLAMRMGGPREALLHALIRKNYGCTHFIIGRDHAGPGKDSSGKDFYDPYGAQKLVESFQDEIGIQMVPFKEMLYVKNQNRYCSKDELSTTDETLSISGTELRDSLRKQKPIPDWFSFPEIIDELRKSYLPKHKKGFTVFFTGLSGAGKTVISRTLYAKLKAYGLKNITLLDSDTTRRILANDLGFSKKDRDLNIRRIGFVASEVTKVGGIALCNAIAPYAEGRNTNRQLISEHGGYVEVHISTPFNECAKRDTKGLYSKALKGEISNFTGYNDPYEEPKDPEISIDTTDLTIDEATNIIFDYLKSEGYIQSMVEESTTKHKEMV